MSPAAALACCAATSGSDDCSHLHMHTLGIVYASMLQLCAPTPPYPPASLYAALGSASQHLSICDPTTHACLQAPPQSHMPPSRPPPPGAPPSACATCCATSSQASASSWAPGPTPSQREATASARPHPHTAAAPAPPSTSAAAGLPLTAPRQGLAQRATRWTMASMEARPASTTTAAQQTPGPLRPQCWRAATCPPFARQAAGPPPARAHQRAWMLLQRRRLCLLRVGRAPEGAASRARLWAVPGSGSSAPAQVTVPPGCLTQRTPTWVAAAVVAGSPLLRLQRWCRSSTTSWPRQRTAAGAPRRASLAVVGACCATGTITFRDLWCMTCSRCQRRVVQQPGQG